MYKSVLLLCSAALLSSAAAATHFTFTDQLDTGALVTGWFDGDLDGNYARNLSNISVFVNGVGFAGNGSLFNAFNTEAGWVNSGTGYMSLDGSDNNFIFIDSDIGNGDYGYSNYFYSITPPYGDLVAGQGGSGQSAPESTLRVTPHPDEVRAVPEVATWAMMMGGFAVIGAGMRHRRTSVRFA
jgi:hypothetical protein